MKDDENNNQFMYVKISQVFPYVKLQVQFVFMIKINLYSLML